MKSYRLRRGLSVVAVLSIAALVACTSRSTGSPEDQPDRPEPVLSPAAYSAPKGCSTAATYSAVRGGWEFGRVRVLIPPDSARKEQNTDVWSGWIADQQAYVQKIPIVVEALNEGLITLEGWRRDAPSVRVRFNHNLTGPEAERGTEVLSYKVYGLQSGATANVALLGLMIFPTTGCYEIWVDTGGTRHGPFGLEVRS